MSVEPVRTHARIDHGLCGTPRSLGAGTAEVELTLTEAMRVDDTGLTHGGFAFGLADHAAMLAVNEPTVVLADASMRFLAPTVVGDRLVARARVNDGAGKRRTVEVDVLCGDKKVADGSFSCAVPSRHVLQRG
ncbi:MAG: thioesterase [Deltaproteobacteria bacterium RBG_16_71_12]|nr:MAG: thioesterase [Deltaproteobacteria bacterium RBG_16_71_12]